MTKENKLVEVARSFSYKLNCGNYESRDFFCSQKVECPEAEAEKKSEELYMFVKNEVMKSVGAYLKENSKPIKKPINKLEKRAESDAKYSQAQGGLQEQEDIEETNRKLADIPILEEPEWTGEQQAESSFEEKLRNK